MRLVTETETDSAPPTRQFLGLHVIRWIGLAILATVFIIYDGYRRSPTQAAEGTSINGTTLVAGKQTFRVGTFNIDGLKGTDGKLDLDRTAQTIQGCDLIGLQEVHGGSLDGSSDQAQLLGEKLALHWLYAPAERQWWRDAFGNALLTSLPVSSWQRFPLSGPAATNNRSFLLAHFPMNGKNVHVLIVHLPTTNDRESELRSISALFFSLAEPAILMGDLNTKPGDPQIEALRTAGGVVDCVDDEKSPHVDWILARGLTCVERGTIDHGASDHPFYWADVTGVARP